MLKKGAHIVVRTLERVIVTIKRGKSMKNMNVKKDLLLRKAMEAITTVF
ncbi:MAG: hypothetical protein QXO35_01800 [Candidatus Micrarchaeia archaeon]